MNRIFNIKCCFLFLLLSLVSCAHKDKMPTFHLGNVDYYSSFLWCKGDTSAINRTFEFELSPDARENNCFGSLEFVDNEGHRIASNIVSISANGKQLKNNIFKFSSSTKAINFVFTAGPKMKAGTLQGQLILFDHNLHRYENQMIHQGESLIVKKWSITFDEKWNPLKLTLVSILLVILSLLVIWFVLVKPILYPRIRLNRIQINSKEKGYYINKRINGARKVIFSAKPLKQSVFNRFFLGKVIYVTSPVWENEWELYSHNRKKEVKINLHGKYVIEPITLTLKNYGQYTLTDEKSNIIKIQIL